MSHWNSKCCWVKLSKGGGRKTLWVKKKKKKEWAREGCVQLEHCNKKCDSLQLTIKHRKEGYSLNRKWKANSEPKLTYFTERVINIWNNLTERSKNQILNGSQENYSFLSLHTKKRGKNQLWIEMWPLWYFLFLLAFSSFWDLSEAADVLQISTCALFFFLHFMDELMF